MISVLYRTVLLSAVATAVLSAVMLLAGCGNAGPETPVAPPPPEVGVLTVEAQELQLSVELPGRTSAYLVADVRPQVSGIIRQRLFTEGADVAAGEPLYLIDPDSYEVAVASAEAALAKAQAAAYTARLRSKRFRDLLARQAISRQDADDAFAGEQQADAEVADRRAQLARARIDLRRTRVSSPISGRIGKSDFTPGALVTADQPQAMATVQQLDPMYVDITRSSQDLLRLRDDMESGRLRGAADAAVPVTLLLEDGSTYPHQGKLAFSDVTIDPTTASVTLRAVFPNPRQRLLPGMYVRAMLAEGVRGDAILLPQEAVLRDPQGNASALVVDAEGTATLRPLQVRRSVGPNWLIESGLLPGEQVIRDGLQKVKPGSRVVAVTRAHDRPALADVASP
ncbi:MAG: efflux RND transporter periplasmic adaptor subunit [Pseudomonadales bacterium]|jgi:membrane fusion protein (multidrug efflux system)|nr:efflux RND transporter periplasmic adaptor subunit [Pseudomonadales bacterium]MBP9032431.1 efflux RND transporter periplasmic adaptor subunit [Pseudomonadales bacterium]